MLVNMKTLIQAAIVSAALAAPTVAWSQETVVVQDPGGAFGEALRRHVFTPFEEKTGIRVQTVQESRGGPRVKAQVEAGKTEWDITFIFDQEVGQLADCCLSTIDYDKMDEGAKKTIATLPKSGVRDHGVALQVIGVGLLTDPAAPPLICYLDGGARTAAIIQSIIETIHMMRKRQVRYNSAPSLAERRRSDTRDYGTLFICRQ